MGQTSVEENLQLLHDEKQESDVKYSLQRVLKFPQGFAFIVGMLLGSGLFISPGLIAERSPNMFIAIMIWVLSGVLSLLGASCCCELASMFNKTGGTYLYICRAFHPAVGFAYAWILILVIEPTVTAIISFSFGSYITRMFVYDENSSLFVWTARGIGSAFMLVLAILNGFRVRNFGVMQSVFTLSQILVVVFVLGLGTYYLISERNFKNFAPEVFFDNTSNLFTLDGVRGLGDAAYSALWAYQGWSCVPFLMEEIENPARNVPLVTFTSIPFVILVYVLINVSFMTALSKGEMGMSSTVGISLAAKVTGNKATFLMSLLVGICCFGTLNSCIYISSRVYMSAAREGHLPSIFLWIHRKQRTPTLAIICHCFISLLWIFLGNKLETFIFYFNFSVWLGYILTFVAIFLLRRSQPHAARTYRVFIITPIIMTFASVVVALLGVAASPIGCAVSLAFLLSSLPFYCFCLRKSHVIKSYGCKAEEYSKRCMSRLGMVPSHPDEEV